MQALAEITRRLDEVHESNQQQRATLEATAVQARLANWERSVERVFALPSSITHPASIPEIGSLEPLFRSFERSVPTSLIRQSARNLADWRLDAPLEPDSIPASSETTQWYVAIEAAREHYQRLLKTILQRNSGVRLEFGVIAEVTLAEVFTMWSRRLPPAWLVDRRANKDTLQMLSFNKAMKGTKQDKKVSRAGKGGAEARKGGTAIVCHSCSGEGHIARNCPSAGSGGGNGRRR